MQCVRENKNYTTNICNIMISNLLSYKPVIETKEPRMPLIK